MPRRPRPPRPQPFHPSSWLEPSLLSLSIAGTRSGEGTRSQPAMCVHIFREHSFSLLKDQFGLSMAGLAREEMVRVSLLPRHPPRVCYAIIETAQQLRGQKTATAVKGFPSRASFPNDHSYLSIYLEQREALPKSTCPHFSLKR